MFKKLQIIIVFSVLLLSSIMIFANMDCPKEKACSPEMHKKGMKMMTSDITGCMFCMKINMILKNSKEIGLTDEQINKIREIEMNCKKDEIKKQAEIDTLNIDKQALLKKSDETNLPEVKNIIQKIAVLKGEIEYNCIESLTKAKKLLTDDQKKKIKELIKEKRDSDEKSKEHKHDKK